MRVGLRQCRRHSSDGSTAALRAGRSAAEARSRSGSYLESGFVIRAVLGSAEGGCFFKLGCRSDCGS